MSAQSCAEPAVAVGQDLSSATAVESLRALSNELSSHRRLLASRRGRL